MATVVAAVLTTAQLAVTVVNSKQKSSCKKQQLTDVAMMAAGSVSIAIMQTGNRKVLNIAINRS